MALLQKERTGKKRWMKFSHIGVIVVDYHVWHMTPSDSNVETCKN